MTGAKRGRGLDSIDAFNDINTLEEYFAEVKRGNQELNEWRIRQEKDIAKQQQRAVRSAVLDILEEKSRLEAAGIKVNAKLEKELRKQAIDEFNKKQQKQALEDAKKLYKEMYKIQTTWDNKRRKENAKANLEANVEELATWNAISSQRKLSKTEREHADKLKSDINTGVTKWATDKLWDGFNSAMANLSNSINATMETYTKNQQKINTRLMGSNLLYGFDKYSAMGLNLTMAVGNQPYFKTETLMNNLAELVDAGIASNLEQRAFIQTAKDGIATTFDAMDSTLLRLIKLQQMDTTALRLGLEASMNRFLNLMTSNTEYMNQTFDNVSEALLEASAVMGASQSLAFEYQVQKWLGTLSGFGLSDSTATSIAQAIGYLGSGNIEALSGTNMLNLVTMAASRAGLDIGSILTNGLNDKTTNKLLESLVRYMVELGSSNSNVVKSELAQTFGLSFADLQAAKQMAPSILPVSLAQGNALTMYAELAQDLTTLVMRTPIAVMMYNLWDNSLYSLGQTMATVPALAALWKVTDLIQQNTGGISIPEIGAMFNAIVVAEGGGTGFDFDINTTVENLMKAGLVGMSSLGMIGGLIGGVSSSLVPASMLLKLGILPTGNPILGANLGQDISSLSGLVTSVSGVAGSGFATNVRANNSSSDIYGSTMADVNAMQGNVEQGAKDRQSEAQNQLEEKHKDDEPKYYDIKEGLEADMKTIIAALGDIYNYMQNGEFETSDYGEKNALGEWHKYGY